MATQIARDTNREAKSKERKARNDRSERVPLPAATLKADAAAEQAAGSADWAARVGGPKSRVAEHAVFLVPGLLGFERFATFGYFADRVVAALRAGLEQTWQQPVPVVAVPIPPTASLAERQRKLVKTLADRLHSLEHGYKPLHVHLVGHSTGGVDANLLTYDAPIGGGSGGKWSDVDPRAPALLSRIRSVTSVGSPHQGACLAQDPAVRFLGERDLPSLLRGLPSLVKLFGEFTLGAISDVELNDLAVGLQREGGKTARFFSEVLSSWDLLADLAPLHARGVGPMRSDVQRRSFVTIAGRPKPGAGLAEPADAFFRDLSVRASGWATNTAEQGALVSASVARLRAAVASGEADELLINAAGVELPHEIDAGHNDGVVNSARQLIDPSDPTELAGIVVGDHYDVVGYYDRHVWTVDDEGHEQAKQMVSGLLHSGSGFRDNQFFELYRRVASVIASAR